MSSARAARVLAPARLALVLEVHQVLFARRVEQRVRPCRPRGMTRFPALRACMLFLLGCLLILAGCQSELLDADGRPMAVQEWLFVSADGIEPLSGFAPRLVVRKGRFHGSLGCNQFSGRYRISGATLRVEMGPRTQIGCARPILERETALAQMLALTQRYTLHRNELTLHTGDGRQVHYRARVPRPNATLVGTRWKLQSVAAPGGMVGTSRSIQELTAVFTGESVRLSHPCFEIDATHRSRANESVFRVTSAADRPCPHNSDALVNRGSLAALLEQSTRLTIVEDRLTLRAGSDLRMDFVAAGSGR